MKWKACWSGTPCFQRILYLLNCLVIILTAGFQTGCSHASESSKNGADNLGRELVLQAQRLQNLHGNDSVTQQLEAIIDSLSMMGENVFYCAGMNVLIDHLMAQGQFHKANLQLRKLEERSRMRSDSVSTAIVRRIKGQIYFKLGMPRKSLTLLDSAINVAPAASRSLNSFSTRASINEWLWIIGMQLGDTAATCKAAREYSDEVSYWKEKGWVDSTGHFPVTAYSMSAYLDLIKGNHQQAGVYLDSASSTRIAGFPVNAYEHYYRVRSMLDMQKGDYVSALSNIDTLIGAHKEFIWLLIPELYEKSRILTAQGRYEEASETMRRYVQMGDSLHEEQVRQRVTELKMLHQSEEETKHRMKEDRHMAIAGFIILIVLVSLLIAVIALRHQRERNRLLVERLQALDKTDACRSLPSAKEERPIDRLDRYMEIEKPYHNISLTRRDLGKAIGVAENEIAILIQQEYGLTVVSYINKWRLEEARHLLETEPAKAIGEIAVGLGFGTARTFQRLFKAEYSMTPSQYRAITLSNR